MFESGSVDEMADIRYRTLKDAPSEVRKSLEILDDIIHQYSEDLNEKSEITSRQVEDIPSEVRHSLGFLDDILDEFEAEEKRLDEAEKVYSTISLKENNLVSEEEKNSLQILDNALDTFGQDDSKWRLRPNAQSLRRNRHEDIRRSLEVLDSVLAEFDDCLESWDSPAIIPDCKLSDSIPELRKKFEQNEENPNGKIWNGFSKSHGKLPYSPKDGTTSQNSSSIQEQPKVSSPPPIPKRSPTTKLSEKNQFSFPSDDTSLDSYDSSELVSQTNGLSEQAVPQLQIRALSSKKNGDIEQCGNRSKPNAVFSSDTCANCGRGLKRKPPVMEGENTPSPFLQRKQVFEAKIAEANASPTRSLKGSSFRVKRVATEFMDTTSSEPSSLPAYLSCESGFNDDVSTSTDGFSSMSLNPCTLENCPCRDRIRRLNEQFSETSRLLKLKKIKVLDTQPPSFVPVPPTKTKANDACQVPTNSNLSEIDDISNEDQSFYSADVSNNCVSVKSTSFSRSDSKLNDFHKLCNRCSNSLSGHFSETIEDLPKLLPTDALNRPHLGFSYSLEEDLSPGVKEIRQTSTPKTGVTPAAHFKTKESNLSTFSHSVSSLGYVSSQSDLELNDISAVPDKVPVSSFKSMTLPNGLDRSPFYSPADEDHSAVDKGRSEKAWHDYNDNRLPGVRKSGHMSTEELRSSSAPLPPPEGEKPKKKHFRAFSRKSKKDKKNER